MGKATIMSISRILIKLLLALSLPAWGIADHISFEFPSEITIKAGFIPADEFGGFQMDLLERLKGFALEDAIKLTFEVTEVQKLYTSNLPLIGPECHAGESVTIENVSYNCSDFDMIVGDYWPNPERYTLVDFTPPWLHTSISALKYTDKQKFPELDVTTLSDATIKGAPVCTFYDSYTPVMLERQFPGINLVMCTGDKDSEDGCLYKLQEEECSLYVSDELVLRYLQADEPQFEMTGEKLELQWLAWPVSRNLDAASAYLLNKWIYSALTNQTVDELYFQYYAKKLCKIGTAGKDCELYCDPAHGSADAQGECVCESPRWTGADCSIEVPEDVNSVPSSVLTVCYIMLVINIMVIVYSSEWLCWHWTTAPVRVSQPCFLLLVLFGCLISSFAIVPMALQEDTNGEPEAACMAMPWLYSVGFSITFGTLFAKIRRVYKLFAGGLPSSSRSTSSNAGGVSYRRNYFPVADTLCCVGSVLLVDVIILVCWTKIDPLKWERVVIREDQFGDPLESRGVCTSDSWEVFALIIALFHFGLMAVACYMCYVARNIPSKFSEHKFVTIAMISNLQIFVVGVPIAYIVASDPGGSFFVRSAIVWMNDLAVITLIFGNLMYNVHFRNRDEENTASAESQSKSETDRNEIDGLHLQESFPQEQHPVDTGHRKQIVPAIKRNKSAPIGVSSLSSPSVAFSERISFKSVSFNEHVSVSEIQSTPYGVGNDESIKEVEEVPLKPVQVSTATAYFGERRANGEKPSSLDIVPSIPYRPAMSNDLVPNRPNRVAPPGASKEEDIEDFHVDSERSSDASPTIPKRAAVRASEMEEVDDDEWFERLSGDLYGRRTKLSVDPNSGGLTSLRPETSVDSFPLNPSPIADPRGRRRMSLDSIPNIPNRPAQEGVKMIRNLQDYLATYISTDKLGKSERSSADSIPNIPRRAAVGASEFEDVESPGPSTGS